VLAQPVDAVGADAERGGQRDEVGVREVHALARVAVQVLVVADHPVAAVVDDHGREGDVLLPRRGQLAAGVQKAAVAGDAHRGPGTRERRP